MTCWHRDREVKAKASERWPRAGSEPARPGDGNCVAVFTDTGPLYSAQLSVVSCSHRSPVTSRACRDHGIPAGGAGCLGRLASKSSMTFSRHDQSGRLLAGANILVMAPHVSGKTMDRGSRRHPRRSARRRSVFHCRPVHWSMSSTRGSRARTGRPGCRPSGPPGKPPTTCPRSCRGSSTCRPYLREVRRPGSG